MSHTASATASHSSRSWTRDDNDAGNFLVSTDTSLIPLKTLNAAFASPELFWANALPEHALRDMLDNSLCFGLYSLSPRGTSQEGYEQRTTLIGFARAITDRVTFLYLTDVYVLPAYQGRGLGDWLVSCVQDVVEDMPFLRRSMCVVSTGGHNTSSDTNTDNAAASSGSEQHTEQGQIQGQAKSKSERFYARNMHMERMSGPLVVLQAKGSGCVV